MSTPAVSVIIPTYNRADLLPRAIRSVVNQTFTDWEVIVVDDGSTDNTYSVVGPAFQPVNDRLESRSHSEFGEQLGSKLVVIRQANAGSSAARNRAIDVARGRFIAFLDSDDEYLPDKLERQVQLFDQCHDVGLVYCDYAYVDLEGRRHESVFDTISPRGRSVARRRIAGDLYECGPEFFDELIQEYFVATITGMVRSEVLSGASDCPIRFPVGLSYAEEWVFFLQVARRTRVGFVDRPLCLHHWTRGSLARTNVKRNLLGMAELLRQLSSRIPHLRAAHRRAIRRNLAHTALQLGYDYQRDGQFAEAAKWFWRAWINKPQRSAAKGAVRCVARRPRQHREQPSTT